MRIKLQLTIGLILMTCFQCLSQQDPQFTQYYFNPLSYNSGYAGTKDALSISLLAREQWMGLEGRPRTQTLSIHSPIGESGMSLGGSFINDLHGPIKSTYLNLDGAYAFNVTDNSKLSLGLRSSLHFYRASLSSLDTGGDVSFGSDLNSPGLWNFGLSAYWYSKTHYVALSAPRLIENDLYNPELNIQRPLEKRHIFLSAGKVFQLRENLKFKPNVFMKYVSAAPLSLDLSANFLYKEKLWAGAFLRLKDAIGFMLSYQLNENLKIGYSYDHSISALSGFNNGSHELLLNYDLRLAKEKALSPRYF